MIWGAIKRTTLAESLAWVVVTAALAFASLFLPEDTSISQGGIVVAFCLVAVFAYRRLFQQTTSRSQASRSNVGDTAR
jgi:membrane protein implicated in regulation of membrane protease activity